MLLQILLIIPITVSIVSSENGSRNEMISDEDSLSEKQDIYKMVTNKESELFVDRSFDAGNLSNALSALVNSTFIFKALLIYWFHLLFQTVGWYLTSVAWNIGREGEVDLDPDLSGAVTDGLLDSDFAATNLALGAGQFVFYFLLWSTVISYGNTNSVRRNSQEDNLWPHSRTDLDLSDNQLAFALDDLFSPATIAKQFVINILGATAGTIFLILISFLPEVFSKRKRKDVSSEEDLPFKIETFSDKWT